MDQLRMLLKLKVVSLCYINEKYNIPTAAYEIFDLKEEAAKYVNLKTGVIKADGWHSKCNYPLYS